MEEETKRADSKTKKAAEWAKRTGKLATKPLEDVLNAVTGKAALNKIAELVRECEAVNTAMATQLYALLDREESFRKTIRLYKLYFVGSLILQVVTLGGFLYLLLRR